MIKEVPQVNPECEARDNSVANAWLIDADHTLTNPLEQGIEDKTLEAMATRAKMGEPVILFSGRDEAWLKDQIIDRLGPMLDSDSFGKVILQGRNSQTSFELRLADENTSEYREYGEFVEWNPARTLDSIESQDILPGSFNIISTRSENLKMDGDFNITTPRVKMFHVGIHEDKEAGQEGSGWFDRGTRNALAYDLTPPRVFDIPSVSEMQFKKIEEWKDEAGNKNSS